MRLVIRVLTADSWRVADVHSSNRGYDLHATRGRSRRLVEVKGVWESAASNGVRLTGNEVLIATQHGRDYWLYVVDQCRDGIGQLYGAFQDPVDTFAADITGDVVFRIPGSSLSRARLTEGPRS